MTTAKKHSRKFLPRFSSAQLFLLFIVVFFALWWAGWSIYNQIEKDNISRVAEDFKPDPSWELTHSKVIGAPVWCGDEPCPYVRKIWKVEHPVTELEFKNRVVKDRDIEYSCTSIKLDDAYCSSKYIKDGYELFITYKTDYQKNMKWDLSVTKSDD